MTELARGFYRITSTATLRWQRTSLDTYGELGKLEPDDLVYAVGGHPKRHDSYFDGKGPRTPGWRTDHTWVIALSTMEDDGSAATGWIDNSCMALTRDDVTPAFKDGDVLYGRCEARELWLQRFRNTEVSAGPKVMGIKYNIIDDLNNALIYGNADDESVQRFAEFLDTTFKCKASSVRIRKMCKCGLTYITKTCKRDVHFVLDGLDAVRVMTEAGVYAKQGITSDQKFCTGAEMRRLMRQRLFDVGSSDGRDYEINLARVSFYLAMSRVPAPWEPGAPANWAKAWKDYGMYRQGKLKNIYL
jgi:hypothetical protein